MSLSKSDNIKVLSLKYTEISQNRYFLYYEKLWKYIKDCGKENIKLSFDEIGSIAGVPIDHSFLRYKNELAEYGYEVKKISMKEENVKFEKCKDRV